MTEALELPVLRLYGYVAQGFKSTFTSGVFRARSGPDFPTFSRFQLLQRTIEEAPMAAAAAAAAMRVHPLCHPLRCLLLPSATPLILLLAIPSCPPCAVTRQLHMERATNTSFAGHVTSMSPLSAHPMGGEWHSLLCQQSPVVIGIGVTLSL
jgi:hypothetical protein